jgi:hypothetical protein
MNKGFESVKITIIVGFMAFLFTLGCQLPAAKADKWPGVDESVVEKYAKEHGREAREPLINTDQGDLLLFVFLLAGTIGGFAAGYSWRMLASEKRATYFKSTADAVDKH